MALDFIAGCIGGAAGVLVGHPFDTVKVRIQVQDPKKKIYHGTWQTFSQLYRQEGVKGLYSGVNSPLAGMAFINAIVFGVYGNSLNAIHDYWKRNSIDPGKSEQLLAIGTAGAIAGFVQVVVCAPMELAKIRLQVDPDRKTYKSITDCLVKDFKRGGLKGLYKGFNITVMREVPSFFVYFYVYEAILMVTGNSTPMMLLSGGLAGCASWISVYPVDVVKTRIQMDSMGGEKPKYRNSWHCLTQGYAEEGYQFLFKGLNSTMVRAFPVNAVTFTVVAWILKMGRPQSQSDTK